MLNGVLRFGFLILSQSVLVDTFYSYPGLSKPHNTVRYATKKLLELREQKSSILSDAIVEHTQILRSRFKCLKEVISDLLNLSV
jgi:methionine S-methyltransferase